MDLRTVSLDVPPQGLSESYTKVDLRTVSFDVPPQEVDHCCIESYMKVDLRTVSFDVPPQEVGTTVVLRAIPKWISGPSPLMCHHKR